jgi:hypothetical protein
VSSLIKVERRSFRQTVDDCQIAVFMRYSTKQSVKRFELSATSNIMLGLLFSKM